MISRVLALGSGPFEPETGVSDSSGMALAEAGAFSSAGIEPELHFHNESG